jgi:hypothetical protein
MIGFYQLKLCVKFSSFDVLFKFDFCLDLIFVLIRNLLKLKIEIFKFEICLLFEFQLLLNQKFLNL